MSDPLGTLFDQFLKERTYLKAVTPKTRTWYLTAWKAFQASLAALGEERHPTSKADQKLTKARLQAFVVHLRDRGVRHRSVNTYLQALNAFCRWLKEEGHAPDPARLSLLKTEKRIISTLTTVQIRHLLGHKPRTLAAHRLHTLVLAILDRGYQHAANSNLRFDVFYLSESLVNFIQKRVNF